MSEQKIIVNNKENKVIELTDFCDLNIEVLNGSTLTLKLANFSKNEKMNFTANVGKDSTLAVIFADFAQSNIAFKSQVNLIEKGANCTWHLATLSNAKFEKKFDVSFIHEVGETTALMDNYGVAKDESNIVFSGVNYIKNGSKKSNTKQNAKIIVFDKDAKGTASPILKIDENDVQASHGAVVGQLNSDHMFYLMSRGLNKEEARMIITLGYLKPISNKFSEDIQSKIENAIKEAM